jgi:translation initiation factor 1
MSKNNKKFTDFTELAKFVFDENPDYVPEPESNNKDDYDKQFLEAHFSKKGRGGKIVTIIKGFEGSEQALKKLGKELKNSLGVGGSVKDGDIIIQGNNRDKIIQLLKDKGFKVKKIGG